MSFADVFNTQTETPYTALGGAPPVQISTVKKELRANLKVIVEMTAEIAKRGKALRHGSGARSESAADSRAQVFAEINAVRETARASMLMLRGASQFATAVHQPELSALEEELRLALARFHPVAESAAHTLGPVHVLQHEQQLELLASTADRPAAAGHVAIQMAHDGESDEPLMAANIRSPSEQQQQQQLDLAATISLRSENITEREAGIAAVQQSVRQVQEIFQDLALLVHEQGSQIDNIQTNVENAAGRVHGGVAQLQTAAKSQKHYRRKLCYGLAFTAVAIIVLLAVLKLVLKAALPF